MQAAGIVTVTPIDGNFDDLQQGQESRREQERERVRKKVVGQKREEEKEERKEKKINEKNEKNKKKMDE